MAARGIGDELETSGTKDSGYVIPSVCSVGRTPRTEWLRGAGGALGAAPAVLASLALASCCFGLVVSPIYQMMTVAVCAFRPEALPGVVRLQKPLSFVPASRQFHAQPQEKRGKAPKSNL